MTHKYIFDLEAQINHLEFYLNNYKNALEKDAERNEGKLYSENLICHEHIEYALNSLQHKINSAREAYRRLKPKK